MALRFGWPPRSTVNATTSKPRVSVSHLTATVVSRPPEKARTIFSGISPPVAHRRRGRPAAGRRRPQPLVGFDVVALRSPDPNQAELGDVTRHRCLRGGHPDAAETLDELFLGRDLVLGDQREDRLLPLTL